MIHRHCRGSSPPVPIGISMQQSNDNVWDLSSGFQQVNKVNHVSFDYRMRRSQVDFTITTPLISALTGTGLVRDDPPPKSPRSAYKLYLQLERTRLLKQLESEGRQENVDVTFELAKKWSKMQGDEKAVFRRLADIDQHRHAEEYREWETKKRIALHCDALEPRPFRENEEWMNQQKKPSRVQSSFASHLRSLKSTEVSQKIGGSIQQQYGLRSGDSDRTLKLLSKGYAAMGGFWDEKGRFQSNAFS